jgi:hypothetical protein
VNVPTKQANLGRGSHTALNVYDDTDRLVATIANWAVSDPANQEPDCVTSSGEQETNVCTHYAAASRTISTTNTLGQTALAFYDSAYPSGWTSGFRQMARWPDSLKKNDV